MPDVAAQIGTVAIAHGTVTAEGEEGVRELTNGSPVFVDETISTGAKGSAVEIKFNDGALLSQGPNSSVVLDHYVFDPEQGAGEMTVKMLQGTFRSVTGEIVDMNPEGFSLETPLATIGIRGTTTGHSIGGDGQEEHVVVDFVDKPVVIRPVSGGPIRLITRDGMAVTATPGGLSPVMQATQSQLSQFEQLSSQSLQQSAPDFNGDNDDDDGDDNGDDDNGGDGEGEGDGDGDGDGEGGVFGEDTSLSGGEIDTGQAGHMPPVPPILIDPLPVKPLPLPIPVIQQQPIKDITPPEPDPVVHTTVFDGTEYGTNLTVNLQGSGGSAPYNSPYYEETGNSDPEKVKHLPTTIHTVFGDSTHDNTITGNGLNNFLYGGTANNTLDGADGNDFMAVGTHDTMTGSFHLDSIDMYDEFKGGDGIDTVAFDGMSSDSDLNMSRSIEALNLGSSVVSITLDNDVVDAGADMTVDGSLSAGLTFSASNDSDSEFLIQGGSGGDVLTGGTANGVGDGDTLFGGAGNDQLSGLDGDDTLSGTGGGDDILDGGAGDDAYYMGTQLDGNDAVGGPDAAGGAGDDTLYFTDNGTGTDDLDNVHWVEHVVLGNAATNIQYANTGDDAGSTIEVNGTALTHAMTLDASGANMAMNVTGGSGFDSIVGGTMGATLVGGAGNDTLKGNGAAVADKLTGGSGEDFMEGGAGNDTFYFNTGDVEENEVINGGDDMDAIEVTTSTDFTGANISNVEELHITAGQSATFSDTTGIGGSWTISGANGTSETLNVNVAGDGGTIDISGLSFNASWITGEDFINLNGSEKQDLLKGSARNETLSGGGDDDNLDDGAGDDRVDGGAGDDFFIAGEGADTILGGSGDDTVYYDSSAVGVNVDLKAGTSSGGIATDDVISGIENLTGSGYGDSLTGEDGANNLVGGLGDDTLEGGKGADFLKGEDGDDCFVFNTGDVVNGEQIDGGTVGETNGDRIVVQTSTDFRQVTSVASIEELEIADDQTATFNTSAAQQSLVLGLSDIVGGSASSSEVLEILGDDTALTLDLSAASATFHAWNTNEDYTFVQGGAAVDNLTAWDTDTYLSGKGGNDVLIGGSGNDTLQGGAGADNLDGSAGGHDVASYAGSVSGVTVNLETGVVSGGDADGDVLTSIEGVIGSDHDDVITGKAGAENSIKAGACHDKIYMGQNLTSLDTLDGGSGNDTLYFQDAGFNDALNNVTNVENIIFELDRADIATVDNLVAQSATLNVDASGIVSESGVSFSWNGSGETDGAFSIQGSTGNDSIIGGAKNDTIDAGAANDTIEGGDGADSLDGGDGFDWISYENSSGQVEFTFGGDANDGYGNKDIVTRFEGVIGSGQGDILNGDDGVNYFIGGIGDDTIDGKGGTSDWVSYATSTSGVTVDLSAAGYQTTNDGLSGGQDSLVGIERIIGSDHVDNLTGDANDNAFMGGLGDDIIDGGDGSDWVRYDNATGGVNVNLQTGVVSGADGADALTSIEKVWGSSHDDQLTGLTDAWSILVGNGGADDLAGSATNMTVAAYYDDPSAVFVNTGLMEAMGRDGWGNIEFFSNINGLHGSQYSDTLIGSDANNHFDGMQGNDVIRGGAGDDTIVFDEATSGVNVNFLTGVVHDGQGGIDHVSQMEHVVGTKYNDSIVGNDAENVFDGGAGNDTLDGGDNDFDNRELDLARYADATSGINANLVTGIVTGGGGNDKLYNMEGVMGTAYDDVFTGDSAQANIFFDIGGADVINGNSVWDEDADTGFDIVSYEYMLSSPFDTGITAIINPGGSGGTDWLVTDFSGDVDTLTGIDMIWGTIGMDTMTGDDSDQQFTPGTGSDEIDGGGTGDDDDVSYFNLDTSLTFSWDTNDSKWEVTDGSWTDTLVNIECIEGSQAGDIYVGSENDDSFNGYKGSDNINGGSGNDWAGYWDNPAFYENGIWKGVFVNLADTTDDNARDGWGGLDTLANIENVDGSDHNDTLMGDSGNNELIGGDGDDLIGGDGGNDRLDGGSGADTFAFSQGDITSGSDTLVGFESGVDKIYIELDGAPPTTWKEVSSYSGSGGGNGDLLVWDAAAHTLWYENNDGVTFAMATSPNGPISMTDIESPSVITDDATGNTIWTGNDDHTGTQFNDIVTGQASGNILEGGAGDDVLTGGGGEDVFKYMDDAHYLNSAGQDTITDFESGSDRIWLDPANAVTLQADNIDLYTVGGYTGTGTGASTEILVWDPTNHKLWYDEAPSTSAAADQGVIADFNGRDITFGDIMFSDKSTVHTITDVSTGAKMIQGSNSADNLTGTDYNDYIYGEAGADEIHGGLGDDWLNGMAGDDTMYGDGGNDTVSYAFDTGSVIADLGTAIFSSTHGGAKNLDGAIDEIHDVENLFGTQGGDVLLGNGQANLIKGGLGNDMLGGMGGADTLSGGEGADTYYFNSTSGDAVDILDFDATQDMIGLGGDAFDMATYFPDGFDASRFANVYDTTYDGTGAFDTNGEPGLVYASQGTTGELWFDADSSTTGDEVLLATIQEQMGGVAADNDLTVDNFVEAMDATGLDMLDGMMN